MSDTINDVHAGGIRNLFIKGSRECIRIIVVTFLTGIGWMMGVETQHFIEMG